MYLASEIMSIFSLNVLNEEESYLLTEIVIETRQCREYDPSSIL